VKRSEILAPVLIAATFVGWLALSIFSATPPKADAQIISYPTCGVCSAGNNLALNSLDAGQIGANSICLGGVCDSAWPTYSNYSTLVSFNPSTIGSVSSAEDLTGVQLLTTAQGGTGFTLKQVSGFVENAQEGSPQQPTNNLDAGWCIFVQQVGYSSLDGGGCSACFLCQAGNGNLNLFSSSGDGGVGGVTGTCSWSAGTFLQVTSPGALKNAGGGNNCSSFPTVETIVLQGVGE
jgi:hypothetical protein